MVAWYKKPFHSIISFFGKAKAKRHFTHEPVYIGGCGRSGTTLLLSMLSAHPEIFACPKELGLFNNVKYKKDGSVVPQRLDRLYLAFLKHRITKTQNRYCEKSPSNVKHIEDIEKFHKGKYKFIHIVRDGRDVILSKHPTDPDRYWVPPERWINDVSCGLKHIDNPNVHTIRYEDLIRDYEAVISGICHFIGIEVNEQILNWHLHTSVTKNRAYFGKVKPVFGSSLSKWKKPEYADRVNELISKPEALKLLKYFNYKT